MKSNIRIVTAALVWGAVVASLNGQTGIAGRNRALTAPAATKPAAQGSPSAAPRPTAPTAAQAPDPTLFKTYCIGCHNERAKVGGLALDALNLDDVAANAETFEKVVLKLKTGLMPPSGTPRP